MNTSIQEYRTWVEISKKALLNNYDKFKKLVGNETKVAVVVKANAYGHGLMEVVSILKNKANTFAVDNISEGMIVKNLKKDADVIVLGYTGYKNLTQLIVNDLSFVLYDVDVLKSIVSLSLKKQAKIHIKIETGLNRQGIDIKNLSTILSFIRKNQTLLKLEGIYTHFANVEDTENSFYARLQLQKFMDAVKIVQKFGFKNVRFHSAASAATLIYPDARLSMIRLGIGLYGLWPLLKTKEKIVLKPVLSWKSRIAQIKIIEKGESVGYGRTWFSPRKSKIAVIPVGYYDGFDRKLSNIGRVLVRGKFVPVVGRVAMNMMTVDVTDIKNVKQGDIATLIGVDGKNKLSADDMAEKIDTINYEIVSRINPLLPRVIK